MTETNLLYLVYGMCIMFHLMMGWVFCCRKTGLVKKLIGLLMLLVAVQYAKDLVFMRAFYSADTLMEHIATSLDMVTVPLYVLILVEFCRPGWLTMRVALYFELPFMLLSVLFMSTQYTPIYYVMVALSAVYGVGCALWTLRELPRYHRRLKEEFSYDEDINLHWMRGVMILFFGILIIWIVGNIYVTPFTDLLYMSSSLVGWSVVCYFINKQEVVLRDVANAFESAEVKNDLLSIVVLPYDRARKDRNESVSQPIQSLSQTESETAQYDFQNHSKQKDPISQDKVDSMQPLSQADSESMASLGKRLEECFEQDKVYLNPKLRLSELAVRLGTNRTYLSQYFNQSCEQSFYEYVNNYRVRHSMQLLRTTNYNLEVVASMSGFNSMSTFRRAFQQVNGISPQRYRACN